MLAETSPDIREAYFSGRSPDVSSIDLIRNESKEAGPAGSNNTRGLGPDMGSCLVRKEYG